MRSIDLKFYGKGIALGLVLTLTVIILTGIGGSSSGASGVFVKHGFDQFTTPSDGNTYHNFTDGPIEAGFFNNPGSSGTSNKYTGAVPLKGVPLPNQGGADTVVSRNQDVTTPGTTTLTVAGLSLASISPLTITFSDGHNEQWNMTVGLSQIQSSTGSMTITDAGSNGGTFDSNLTIIPRFTFTRVSDGLVKVWDTGNGGRSSATLEASRQDLLSQSAATVIACPIIATPTSQVDKGQEAQTSQAADATGSSAPIILASTGTRWTVNGNGGFIIPVPPTEEDRWRRHQPSPTPTPCKTQVPTQPQQ